MECYHNNLISEEGKSAGLQTLRGLLIDVDISDWMEPGTLMLEEMTGMQI